MRHLSGIIYSKQVLESIQIVYFVVLSLLLSLFSSAFSIDAYKNEGPKALFSTMDELSVLVNDGTLKLILDEG